MNGQAQRDVRNSAIVGKTIEKPPRMHFNKSILFAMFRVNRIDPKKVESIRYLGNRIIGSIANGQQFVLR